MLRNTRRNLCLLPTSFKCIRSLETENDNLASNGLERTKMELIKNEMLIERYSGNFFIPDKVEEKHWKNLLQMNSVHARRKYFRYLKTCEIENEKGKKKHVLVVAERKKKQDDVNLRCKSGHIKYGLGFNSIFHRVNQGNMNQFYKMNLVHALTFGQNVVVDLSFEKHMNNYEITKTVNQISMLYSSIKHDQNDPYRLYLCNVGRDGRLENKLKLGMPFLQDPHPLITLTDMNYLDMFAKEKIVYLHADCTNDLIYNHDDVYVIGGLVDTQGQGRLCCAKAKKEGLRVARFPLEKYLSWGSGSRNLTIDRVMKILITMKNTMDWEKALEHVPKRKLNTEQTVFTLR